MGIRRRLIDVARGVAFCFLRGVWGCIVFFAFAFGVCGGCCCDLGRFFLKGVGMGVGGGAGFCADFGFFGAGFRECPLQKLKAKNHKKCSKTKILKIRIVFWL